MFRVYNLVQLIGFHKTWKIMPKVNWHCKGSRQYLSEVGAGGNHDGAETGLFSSLIQIWSLEVTDKSSVNHFASQITSYFVLLDHDFTSNGMTFAWITSFYMIWLYFTSYNTTRQDMLWIHFTCLDVNSKVTKSSDVMSSDVKWNYVSWSEVMFSHVKWRGVKLCHAMSSKVMSRHITLCQVKGSEVMSCQSSKVTSRHVKLVE